MYRRPFVARHVASCRRCKGEGELRGGWKTQSGGGAVPTSRRLVVCKKIKEEKRKKREKREEKEKRMAKSRKSRDDAARLDVHANPPATTLPETRDAAVFNSTEIITKRKL